MNSSTKTKLFARSLTFFLFSFLAYLISCSKPGGSSGNNPPPGGSTIHVTGISLNSNSITISPGGTQQLTATVTPSNATNKKISWSSNNNNVARVDTNGLVTAVTAGSATITATSNDNGSITASSSVAVLQNYDVYVVGYGPTSSYTRQGLYWKNGVTTVLTGGFNNSYNANAITVVNTDVYIAGTTLNPNLWQIITYWKNGVPLQLTNPATMDTSYFTNSIAVSGNDVFISGWDWFYRDCPNCSMVYNAFYFKVMAAR